MIKKRNFYNIAGVVCLILTLTTIAEAQIYQYTDKNGALHITDDPGSIPEKARKRGLVVEDNDQAPSSISGTSNKAHEVNVQSRVDIGPRVKAPFSGHAALPEPTQQSSPASQPAPSDPPDQQLMTINTDTRNSSAIDEFFARRFRSMMEEKFKDVKDPAQLQTLNADISIDCTKYKKTMAEDMANADALMKDANMRRARGDSIILIKLQVI